jgi:hypothetical protein
MSRWLQVVAGLVLLYILLTQTDYHIYSSR